MSEESSEESSSSAETPEIDEEVEAIWKLGLKYQHGEEVPLDSEKAVQLFKESSEKGSIQGKVLYANCLFFGIGIEKDVELAFGQYSEAAEGDDGDSKAMVMVGICYLLGLGTPKNEKASTNCFKGAAKAGNPEGMWRLARARELGRGCPKDLEKAEELYRKAVELGDQEGQWRLALMLKDSDKAESEKLLDASIEAGNPVAKLIKAHQLLSKSTDQSTIDEVVKFLEEGCLTKNANSLWMTGIAMLNSSDKEAQAFAYIKSAAELNCLEAQWRYGIMLQKGIGTTADEELGQQNLLKAAENGNVEALLRYGYYMETKTRPDEASSAMAYRAAANLGDKRGKYFYGMALLGGNGVSQDINAGVRFVQEAADAGLVEAQLKVGKFFQHGVGYPESILEAKRYYELALKNGNQEASKLLSALV